MYDNKIKLIIYGVRCNRLEFEMNLKNNYIVVGYCDGAKEYSELTEFDYKPFIQIENLHKVEFDYIVILPSGQAVKEISKKLISNRIVSEKIIEFGSFKNCDFRNPLQEYINLDKGFDGFVFGMSHSFDGFLTHWFDKKFFKFSAPSMDLYYHYKLLNTIVDNYGSLLKKSNNNYFIFELPYYIFNYDLSKFIETFKTRINYFEELNDYHNFGIDIQQKKYLDQYEIIKDMLTIKNRRNNISINNFEKNTFEKLNEIDKENLCKQKAHIWYDIYELTIQENIVTWNNIIKLVKSINPNCKIGVIVYPHNPYFLKCHQVAIEKMKNIFYKYIKSCDDNSINIFDYHDKIRNEDSFVDCYHMNGNSYIEFSKFINAEFQNKFYI